MSTDEAMTIDERRKYLKKMQQRYRPASRGERGRLLDEMETVSGLHRKSLIRLMKGDLRRRARRRQRGVTYGPAVRHVVAVVAESLDWVCAERVQPALVWMAEQLAQHGELEVSPAVLQQLGRISVSTVRRLLRDVPRDRPRRARQGPRRSQPLLQAVPVGRIPWQTQEPGYCEMDLVHHCGVSASGHYVHTLQLTDVATGWTELVAVLGRSGLVIQDALQRILARLPFPLREVHSDNGSEFLNDPLLRFWDTASPGVHLSRSRPWHKNDNRFVEQSNDSQVRAYVGYERLDTVAHTNLLNQLYDALWVYQNLFQPGLRLASKQFIPAADGQPARLKRRFSPAQTPFQRAQAAGGLTSDDQTRLQALRAATNPRQLRRTIYALLDQLWALPPAPPGSTQDVYLTLFNPPQPLKGEDAGPVTLSIDRTTPSGNIII